jgi:hypothetical protein
MGMYLIGVHLNERAYHGRVSRGRASHWVYISLACIL